MQRFFDSTFIACLLITISSQANADLVQFNFTGTISAAFDNDPGSNPDTVFGAVVGVGDSVSGFFSYDTNAAETDSVTGLTGGGSSYHQNLPYKIHVEMDGVVFESDGLFDTTVLNDFTFASGQTPIDIFGTADGVEGSQADVTGVTMFVDGVAQDGRIGLQFNDDDATAFASTALPTAFNLSDFEFAEGRIVGTDSGGIFHFATFNFTSLEAATASVPEPSSLSLLGMATLGLISFRRSRRRRIAPV